MLGFAREIRQTGSAAGAARTESHILQDARLRLSISAASSRIRRPGGIVRTLVLLRHCCGAPAPGRRSVQGKVERQACSLPREWLRSGRRYAEARRQDRYADRVVSSGRQYTRRREEIKAGNIGGGRAHGVSIGVQDTERGSRHAHAGGSRHVTRNRIGDFARPQAVDKALNIHEENVGRIEAHASSRAGAGYVFARLRLNLIFQSAEDVYGHLHVACADGRLRSR